jgi:hypothetical protein
MTTEAEPAARRSTARHKNPRQVPELPREEISRLVDLYRRDQARWDGAPGAADTARRLYHFYQLALETREALESLHKIAHQLAGFDEAETRDLAHELLTKGSAAGAAVHDLDRRGAGNGGARHVLKIVEPEPKGKVILELRALFRARGFEPTQSELKDAATDIFTEAGDDEPSTGLDKVFRRLLKFQN